MDIEFAQLRTLAAVVDEGTFEAAARTLHVTPSAVSQRIKALEQQVGGVLVRRSKPVQATESGQVVLRLAKQVARLEQDALDALAPTGAGPVTVTIVVNADSLTTWMIPALGRVDPRFRLQFDLRREDEYHSAELLRDGTAMAAVTSEPEAVQGCSVVKLGAMRYRALCSPEFAGRWFPDGADAESLASAPVVDFDRKDDLQTRFLRRVTRRRVTPPRHYVPGSSAYADAVRHGLGWGMVPQVQAAADLAAGAFVEVLPDAFIDVPLYWQRWKLDSPALAAVTDAVREGARGAL